MSPSQEKCSHGKVRIRREKVSLTIYSLDDNGNRIDEDVVDLKEKTRTRCMHCNDVLKEETINF